MPLQSGIVLGIGAHPDDLDFMAAGSLAWLASQGAEVYYLILTDGCKGSEDPTITPQELADRRCEEQRQAAQRAGIKDVIFLSYADGELEVNQQLKKDIVRVIRQVRPDVVFAMDPTMVYSLEQPSINHPDHRAGGQAALDAIYPLARDHLSFPELLNDEQLQPHKVLTILLTNFDKQDYYVDITSTIDAKIAAIAAHTSQVKDMATVEKKVRAIAQADGSKAGYAYAEGFVRLDID